MSKLHIKKGDTVKVLSGADNGKTGKIINVDREKGRAFVEGVNLVSKHTKPSAANPQGGIVKREASVHISNLMVVDSKGQASRIGRKLNKDGKLVRYSKKSGEVLKCITLQDYKRNTAMRLLRLSRSAWVTKTSCKYLSYRKSG